MFPPARPLRWGHQRAGGTRSRQTNDKQRPGKLTSGRPRSSAGADTARSGPRAEHRKHLDRSPRQPTAPPVDRFALVSMARPGARIIGETLNPYGTANPDHLRYQDENRRLGRLPGQLRLRIRRGLLATPWWDYLFCTPTELEAILARTRWALADAYSGAGDDDEGGAWSHGQWTAVLTCGAECVRLVPRVGTSEGGSMPVKDPVRT